MSENPPPGEPGDNQQNPFGNVPIFGDLARILQQQGQLNWEAAQQFALSVLAAPTDADSVNASSPLLLSYNVDPIERIKIQELARVAELFVANTTGLSTSVTGRILIVDVISQLQWVNETLASWRPLFERLATALKPAAPFNPATLMSPEGGEGIDAFLGGLMSLLSPTMLAMAAGSMAGNLAHRAFGLFELPIPAPLNDRIAVVPGNVDAFASQWSIPIDDLRLWVLLHDITYHSVFGVGHVRDRIDELVGQHASGFRPDPSSLEDRMSSLTADTENPFAAIQQLMTDPEVLLGASRSPEQAAVIPQLDAAVAALVGYVDWVIDQAGPRLLTSYAMTNEALRRRRVESTPADRLSERLLGLNLTRAQVERGHAFVAGVIERGGPDALGGLFSAAGSLPTPNEIEAPGLWLARLAL